MTLYGAPLADPLRPWETDEEPAPAEPERDPHRRRWLALGLVLEIASAFLVIGVVAVLIRLATR
jgi:hypothetical protein